MPDPHDRKFMRKALTLAEKSAGVASPNPPVGCVIVREGRILGQGWHEYQSRHHAEAKALAGAPAGVRGATAYITLEPCVHYGRTPPCAAALIAAGVRRVVIGREDPNPLVTGKGISVLRSAGVEVEAGVFQLEAGRIIEPFACHVTTGMPLVVCKVGMSLDGRIATGGDRSDRITSEPSREFSQRLRLQLDALLVGVETILIDDPQLTYRGKLPKAHPLIAVVLDSHLRTPPTARIFQERPEGSILIYCRADAPEARRRELQAKVPALSRWRMVRKGSTCIRYCVIWRPVRSWECSLKGKQNPLVVYFRQTGGQVLFFYGSGCPRWQPCGACCWRRGICIGRGGTDLQDQPRIPRRQRSDSGNLPQIFPVNPLSLVLGTAVRKCGRVFFGHGRTLANTPRACLHAEPSRRFRVLPRPPNTLPYSWSPVLRYPTAHSIARAGEVLVGEISSSARRSAMKAFLAVRTCPT